MAEQEDGHHEFLGTKHTKVVVVYVVSFMSIHRRETPIEEQPNNTPPTGGQTFQTIRRVDGVIP